MGLRTNKRNLDNHLNEVDSQIATLTAARHALLAADAALTSAKKSAATFGTSVGTE